MYIYPAIDLRDGKVVRLTKGDYNAMTVYNDDPVSVAKSFYDAGATCLHVVDLDGAKEGKAQNAEVIGKIASEVPMFIEVGGGIRTEEQILAYKNQGIKRVILGTVAVRDYGFVERMTEKYGDLIAVGVDALGGKVAVSGWLETTEISDVEFLKKLYATGVKTVIYTDISKDGMLSGTNIEQYKVVAGDGFPNIIASGGVSSLEELAVLSSMGIYGAIIGKALYTGTLSLKDALQYERN